jgi:hypothetical protein
LEAPFPLMGKGLDRGARQPIKPITPTLSFPVKGKELGRSRRLGSLQVDH